MADVAAAIVGNDVRNGSVVVKTHGQGNRNQFQVQTDRVINTPTIGTLDDKYADRFDDPRYHAGDTAA